MLKLSTMLPPTGERVRFAQLILCDLARVTKKSAALKVRPRFASQNTKEMK